MKRSLTLVKPKLIRDVHCPTCKIIFPICKHLAPAQAELPKPKEPEEIPPLLEAP